MLALAIVGTYLYVYLSNYVDYVDNHGERIHVSFVVLISVEIGVIICKSGGASKRRLV